MPPERIPIGENGQSRLLRERGTGRVVEEVALTGDVPLLLAAILDELRLHTQLLASIADEDLDPDGDQ